MPATPEAGVCGACNASLAPTERAVLATPPPGHEAPSFDFHDYHAVRLAEDGLLRSLRRWRRRPGGRGLAARMPATVAAGIDGLLAASATSLLLSAAAFAHPASAALLHAHLLSIWVDAFVLSDVLLRVARVGRGLPTLGLAAAGQQLPQGPPRVLWVILPSPVNAALMAAGLWPGEGPSSGSGA